MQLQAILVLVEKEMQQVDKTIALQLGADVSLITELAHHIFGSGGKRLRPLLVLLATKVFNYDGEQHINLAAIIELVHTATLLHDDVVDSSSLRRGLQTANIIWGNEASVLVGDFLYSRAFQLMVNIGNLKIMEILANSSNIIAEGEVMQLVNCKNSTISEAQYFETIHRKTATLFQAAAQIGAIITQQSATITAAMASYGLHLGIAFQLIDDALDYGASATNIGKNLGDDLAEGKPTLPLLYLLQHGNERQKALIKEAIENPNTKNTPKILEEVKASGAIEYTYAKAKAEIQIALKALEHLPKNRYLTALKQLAEFAVAREF